MIEQKDSQALMQQAQTIEQALHAQTTQRATLQQQLGEADNALEQSASSPEAYRIIGNIMVKTDPTKLRAELEEKKSNLIARIGSVERQEKRLREQLEELQKRVLKS